MAENENAGGYTVVQKWMAAELKLKGTELVLYSLIFNFTQTNGGFSGSLSYLQEWTNCTKQGLIKCLKSMEANHLIAKQEHFENGRRFVSYHTTELNTVKLSLPDPVKQSLTPHATKFNDPLNLVEHPVKQSLPKNIDKNIDKNISISPLNPPAGEVVGVEGVGGEEKFFSVFWEEYPKKTEYEKVRQTFREMRFTDESFGKLMFLLDGWKRSDQWTKSGGQFITSPYNFLTKIFPHNQQPPAAPPPRPSTPTGFESSSFGLDDFTEAALRNSYGEDYDTLFPGG